MVSTLGSPNPHNYQMILSFFYTVNFSVFFKIAEGRKDRARAKRSQGRSLLAFVELTPELR
jgi:hypothetical protein